MRYEVSWTEEVTTTNCFYGIVTADSEEEAMEKTRRGEIDEVIDETVYDTIDSRFLNIDSIEEAEE